MKQLTCEMCGSTDLVKDGGVFVCQSCGCKYSVEEAKKMMIEGKVDVSGSSVKIDKSDSVETYLKMAEAARKGSNYLEAENYANKVLEIQPENAEAWYIKGVASGWQSSGVNYRFKEVLDCYEKYINLEPDEEKKQIRRRKCDLDLSTFIDAMTMLRCETFETVATEEMANEIFSEFDTNIRYLKLFYNKSGYTETYEQLVRIYNNFVLEANSAFVNACDESNQRFGPDLEDKSDGAFRIWIHEQNLYAKCFHTLLGYIKDEETLDTVYNNLKSIRNSLLNSWSYEMFVSGYSIKYRKHLHLNDESKRFHNKQLAEEKEIYQKTKDKIGKEKAISKKKRIDAYWERHPEEKESLDKEKEDVEKRLSELRQERSAVVDSIKKEADHIPGVDDIEELKKEVGALQTQKSALGVFKSKEKKELQLKTDELENKIKGIETRIKETKEEIELRANRKFLSFEKDIKSLEQRKSEIEKELTKER